MPKDKKRGHSAHRNIDTRNRIRNDYKKASKRSVTRQQIAIARETIDSEFRALQTTSAVPAAKPKTPQITSQSVQDLAKIFNGL